MHRRGLEAARSFLVTDLRWVLVVLATVAVSCSAQPSGPVRQPPVHGAASTAGGPAATAPRPSGYPTPATYDEACELEPQVCRGATGTLSPALGGPLHLPQLGAAACPTTHGEYVRTPAFAGIAFGNGPVRPLVSDETATQGIIRLTRRTDLKEDWYGFKTLWYAEPSYRGPFIVRGGRLDGVGSMVFGEGPRVGALVVPPGDTVNEEAGYRQAPGGTYVTSPGCYGWQVDGEGFSQVIVVQAVTQ